jgi:GldM C-terminal domain
MNQLRFLVTAIFLLNNYLLPAQVEIRNQDLKKPEQHLLYVGLSQTIEVIGVSGVITLKGQSLSFGTSSVSYVFEVIPPKPGTDTISVFSDGKLVDKVAMTIKRIPDIKLLLSGVLKKHATVETIIAQPKLTIYWDGCQLKKPFMISKFELTIDKSGTTKSWDYVSGSDLTPEQIAYIRDLHKGNIIYVAAIVRCMDATDRKMICQVEIL